MSNVIIAPYSVGAPAPPPPPPAEATVYDGTLRYNDNVQSSNAPSADAFSFVCAFRVHDPGSDGERQIVEVYDPNNSRTCISLIADCNSTAGTWDMKFWGGGENLASSRMDGQTAGIFNGQPFDNAWFILFVSWGTASEGVGWVQRILDDGSDISIYSRETKWTAVTLGGTWRGLQGLCTYHIGSDRSNGKVFHGEIQELGWANVDLNFNNLQNCRKFINNFFEMEATDASGWSQWGGTQPIFWTRDGKPSGNVGSKTDFSFAQTGTPSGSLSPIPEATTVVGTPDYATNIMDWWEFDDDPVGAAIVKNGKEGNTQWDMYESANDVNDVAGNLPFGGPGLGAYNFSSSGRYLSVRLNGVHAQSAETFVDIDGNGATGRAIAMSIWFKPATLGALRYANVFQCGRWYNVGGGLMLWHDGNYERFYFGSYVGGYATTDRVYIGSSAFRQAKNNEWCHVFFTYDPITYRVKIWVKGVCTASVVLSGHIYDWSHANGWHYNATFFNGGGLNSGDVWMDAHCSQIVLWNTNKDEAEAQGLWNDGNGLIHANSGL